MIDKDLKQSIREKFLSLGRARRATGALLNAKVSSDIEALPLFDKAVGELRKIYSDDLTESLEKEREKLRKRADEALQRRREDLHKAAEEAGWATRRLRNFDRVGCFRVECRRERVTVTLGSERCDRFDETNGRRVFDRLQKKLLEFREFPFSRDDFFLMVKDAVRIARILGLDRDGKVPIRKIYPLCTLARQGRNEEFMKDPSEKNFSNYSLCQFIYDMARFGRSGWRGDRGERIASRTPNMASVFEGKTLALPSLDSADAGPQIAVLWIEKA